MYFITVFDKIDSTDYLVDFGDQRTWGYYPEYETAVAALHENRTDMNEGCYKYAIVEKIGPGLSAHCEEKQWFEWNKEKEGYFEIEEPECVKYLTNFAIG